jgi:hypothetical protein
MGVAAVAGVAHHAGAKSAQAQAQQQAQDQQLADLEAQNEALAAQQQAMAAQQQAPVAAPAAPAAPAAAEDPLTAQLNQLASLHNAGILSDEEFAAAKAKALGIG